MSAQMLAKERVQSYMTQVFGWMAGALSLTGIMSYAVAAIPVLRQAVLMNPGVVFGLILVQLAAVFFLSFKWQQLSFQTALGIFIAYAGLTGATLSSIFLVYTTASIVSTFFVAAGMYGIMAVYGATTDVDLTSMGTYLRMALIGLIIAMVVNLFLRNPILDLATAMIGVIIFAGLTAYDVQKLQQLAYQLEEGHPLSDNIAIIMALQLYLDFINLFLSLLRLMG